MFGFSFSPTVDAWPHTVKRLNLQHRAARGSQRMRHRLGHEHSGKSWVHLLVNLQCNTHRCLWNFDSSWSPWGGKQSSWGQSFAWTGGCRCARNHAATASSNVETFIATRRFANFAERPPITACDFLHPFCVLRNKFDIETARNAPNFACPSKKDLKVITVL